MFNVTFLLIATLLAAGSDRVAAAVPQEQPAATWLESYDQALALSRKTGKPVLADFTGSDWCTWCIRLEREVFDQPAFQAWAKDNVVLLELDYPRGKPQSKEIREQNARLSDKYRIRGYPTILFLDGKGKVLGRSGYRRGGPDAWTRHASQILTKAGVKPGAAAAGGSTWLTDYAKARELSRKSGKPILADFTGSDWCTWCVRLKREVFDQPAFQAWAKDHVILLELDFPRRPQDPALRKQNRALAERYGIRGYPTVLFLDADGKRLGEMGYERGGPKPWIANAKTIIDG